MLNYRRYLLLGCVALLVGAGLTACGDADAESASLRVKILGWGPGLGGELGFQTQLPQFPGADQVRVRLTQPAQGKVLETQVFPAAQKNARLPELKRASAMRLEFDLLNAVGGVVARGATPRFEFDGQALRQNFSIQVDAVNDFAPIGAVINNRLSSTYLDDRGVRAMGIQRWMGRVGHQTVTIDGGNRAVVIGGADVGGNPVRAGQAPQFVALHDDLQEFNPNDGYFTDLSLDASGTQVYPGAGARLQQGRAFHTVTPIGDDKFLVIGGLGSDGTSVGALSSIELVDFRAAKGSYVSPLMSGETGMPLALATPRAFHTATYRPADNSVVVTGGVGANGTNQVLDSVEVINLGTRTVTSASPLGSPRANHQALLMGDGQTIWVMGGRDSARALRSTESISLVNAVVAGPQMRTARYNFSALLLGPGNGEIVMVLGGNTDLEGGATATFELGKIDRVADGFIYQNSYSLKTARGSLQAIELPNSHDIVVLGGWDAQRRRVGAAEVLKFSSLTNLAQPYSAALTATRSVNDRADGSATLLSNGKILLAGGMGDTGMALDLAEYFTPLDPRPEDVAAPEFP